MHQAMQYARRHYLPTLAMPKNYRVGKFTGYGFEAKKRYCIVDLTGRGVIKRFWFTHSEKDGTLGRLYVYVDGADEPVLSGPVHEIAQAAARISSVRIPIGGYRDGKASNLYLPIAFSTAVRVEIELVDDPGDGPAVQVDYALDTDEIWPTLVQGADQQGMTLSYDSPSCDQAPDPPVEIVEQEFELRSACPGDLRIDGPGVITRLQITCEQIDSLLLRIAFDDAITDPKRLDEPFQVAAPLRYLVGQFHHAGVQRQGTTAVIHFPMPFQRIAGIQLNYAMDYGTYEQKYPVKLRVEYQKNPPDVEKMYYFHARFASQVTNGYDDFQCLATSGPGHFVGIHLFDTGHDHGGGESILFDAGPDNAGQFHGICGEDYFHMAYFRVWNQTPYSGCPTHSQRYRHHLELPIPFVDSFVFNWGCYAQQPAKSVAFWYQKQPCGVEQPRELTWQVTGPFALDTMKQAAPDADLPSQALVMSINNIRQPAKTWFKRAQRGFVDLCHIHRHYIWAAPVSHGGLSFDCFVRAQTHIWAAQDAPTRIWAGCDDPIRVFINDELILDDPGRSDNDPYKQFSAEATLQAGLNRVTVFAANTINTNWMWYGFSLRLENDLSDGEMMLLA